jgi:hypothetical protein
MIAKADQNPLVVVTVAKKLQILILYMDASRQDM